MPDRPRDIVDALVDVASEFASHVGCRAAPGVCDDCNETLARREGEGAGK